MTELAPKKPLRRKAFAFAWYVLPRRLLHGLQLPTMYARS